MIRDTFKKKEKKIVTNVTLGGRGGLDVKMSFYKVVFNPLRAESVYNFGIFLNFNFPKNTFKYSKSHSQDTSKKIKSVKYHHLF